MNDDFPSDHAFTLFLGTVELDAVRLEQASAFTDIEWHALARDRRVKVSGPEFALADAIRTMVPVRGYYTGVCGETSDHDEMTLYEDETLWQGVCRNCGGEVEWDALA